MKSMDKARELMAIARNGEESVITKVVALESAYKLIVYADDIDIDDAIKTLGINHYAFVRWQADELFEKISNGNTIEERSVMSRTKAIAMELFPEVEGMVGHE